MNKIHNLMVTFKSFDYNCQEELVREYLKYSLKLDDIMHIEFDFKILEIKVLFYGFDERRFKLEDCIVDIFKYSEDYYNSMRKYYLERKQNIEAELHQLAIIRRVQLELFK